MSEAAASPSSSSASQSSPSPAGIRSLVGTAQFIWFCGHVASLTGAFFFCLFSLKVFRAPSFPVFWYREAFVAAIFTFGIILNQTYRGRTVTLPALVRDDNVHYLIVAGLWVVSKPFFMTLPPFMIFSLFHVLTYLRSFLLPALGHSASSPISSNIHKFVTQFNDQFMMVAASTEMILFVRLLFSFLTFRKGTTLPFAIFFVFIKLRYDCSAYTRTVVRSWEVRIDNVMNNPNVPAVVKNAWLSFKHIIRTYVGGLLRVPASAAASSSSSSTAQ